MSLTRENPLDVANLGPAGLSRVLYDQVQELYRRVEDDNRARQDWIAKQEKLIRQRRGVRRPKVFPWRGAANYAWPLTDSVLRRWKPNIAALVLQADPVCYFFPQNPDAVRAQAVAQAYYHWRFQSMAGVVETILELVDYVGQHGLAYSRQGWEYRTDRQCRVVRVESLFPTGVERAHEAYNAQVAQARAQAEAAVAAGQMAEEELAALPQEQSLAEFVASVLEDEYIIKADNPLEAQQVYDAVEAILGGAQVVKFYYRVVVADRPSWKALSPLDVIVPPRARDIEDADRIAIVHRMSADDVLKLALDGHFERGPAQDVAEHIRARAVGDSERSTGPGTIADTLTYQVTTVLDQADGVTQGFVNELGVGTFVECYAKLDLDGDGLLERAVLWYHPGTKIVLSLKPYPYPFREWPVVRYEFEHNSPRPYGSRGIAELLTVFQAQRNKIHNARLDAMAIVLSPMFQMRATSGDLHRNVPFHPGAIIPVQQVGDFQPVPMDMRPLLSALQEENFTKADAEQYIGIFDPGILSQNTAERRTASEVEAILSQTNSIFGQDATLFQSAMKRVHEQLWALELEFGPEELVFRVTGEEMPRFARKSEIAEHFDLVPSGTPANTSKQLAVARAREALQIFAPDATGIIDKHELYTHYFRVIDRNLGKLIVRRPEQAALIQQMQALVQQLGQEPAPPP